jgi:glycosyltransferase involved in cell wall biosynthesis
MGHWPRPANLQLVRIMHFTDTYLPRRDGVITSLRTLREALARSGHLSHVVVPAHPAQSAEPGLVRLPALACGVADLRLARWPLRPLQPGMIARLGRHTPDLIHVHSPGPVGLLGVIAARELGVPLVQTYHTDLHAYADAYRVPGFALRALAALYARRLGISLQPPLLCTPRRTSTMKLRLWVQSKGAAQALPSVPGKAVGADAAGRGKGALDLGNELLLGPADAVIVPTPAVLERVTLPVDPQRIYLVPTGVARPGPAADISHWGIQPDDRVVLFVGRVNREKGIDLLLPAFDRVLRAHPRARLVLVGAVYEPRWLRRMIRNDRVIVTGQQPPEAVAAAYERADVFAFPSGTDTQALVLQEAALAGVPSVLVDPVLHRRGALAGAAVLASRETFADAIIELLADPTAATALGELARANAARHTPQAFAAAMLDIYGKFVACGRTRSATPARADAAHSAA